MTYTEIQLYTLSILTVWIGYFFNQTIYKILGYKWSINIKRTLYIFFVLLPLMLMAVPEFYYAIMCVGISIFYSTLLGIMDNESER